MALSLDQIAAASEDLKRQQQREGIRQMTAEMATAAEKRRIAEEDWTAPPDVERVPEQTVPDDWLLQEAFANARARQGLAEEQTETPPHYLIEDTD